MTTSRPGPIRSLLTRQWKLLALGGILALAIVTGAGMGYFLRFDLPDVRALEDYDPPVMTRVLDDRGALLDTFFEERRIMIEYHDIPESFVSALLATEDANFHKHTGIDFTALLRAAWRDLRSLRKAQGASTLTQQLARNLFLHRKKTFRRKLQEALLALDIERQYTKEEILRFYCNQIYMGHGRYGLEAAARFYFGLPARELSLTQSALLAGVVQRPESLSPFKHPDRAMQRRNFVLRRMATVGALTAELAQAAQQEPIRLRTGKGRGSLGPYFVEEVRRWLQDRHGSSSLYKSGLEVRTTLDPRLQEIANRAVDDGLRELDRRQGWRGASERLPEGEDLAMWQAPGWDAETMEPGSVQDGLVVATDGSSARVRCGPYTGKLGPAEIEWTGEKDPRKLLNVGDLIRVRLLEILEDGAARLTLEQEPVVEGALIVLDPSSGAVRAVVGGLDYSRSEFNRAVQAKRQTGSAFKPFVYAAALSAGHTLASTIVDEPTVFLDPRKPEPYQPENYTNRYYGTITLRTALEKSANIATVKLLDEIGYDTVIETARKLGIGGHLRPFASMALGSFETTLLDLTAAYGTFANQGVLVEPHFIEEVLGRDGALIERVEPTVRDAVGPEIAYLMNRLLAGVISDGTGRSAASLNLPLAGKTGTTDENTDAWFIGYAPGLAVGVWVGFDEPKSLGEKETGARAALPIWRSFMQEAYAGSSPEPFPMPPGVTIVSIDRRTGLRASRQAYCSSLISEVFIAGTEPTEYCSVFEHQRLRMPYKFQRYPLSERGELMIPALELESLLELEPNVRLMNGARSLEAFMPDQVVSMPLQILPGGEPDPALDTDPRLEEFDTTEWIGQDGRKPRVVWIDGRGRGRTGG